MNKIKNRIELHVRYQSYEMDLIAMIYKRLVQGLFLIMILTSLYIMTKKIIFENTTVAYASTSETTTVKETMSIEPVDNTYIKNEYTEIEIPMAGLGLAIKEAKEEYNRNLQELKRKEALKKKYRYIAEDWEFSIMCQIVEAEVTGTFEGVLSYQEAYECKIRVAQVILNRIESPDFPNDIENVVFEKYAFSPIVDGRYWEVSVTDITKKACEDALLRETPDYTDGALYFSSNTDYCEYGYPMFTDSVNHTYFYPYNG